MKLPTANKTTSPRKANRREAGTARTVLLVSAFFVLGAALSAFWFARDARPGSQGAGKAQALKLSPATTAALAKLSNPLEVRFYSLLDLTNLPPSVIAFADRAAALVSAYERESGGKIKVIISDTPSDAALEAAAKDGLKPFNIEKGDACYLGLAVAGEGQKESIPQLNPDWEAALESDLTRAIVRVASQRVSASASASRQPISPTVIEEIKRALPNYDSSSVEEGTLALRQAALKEFTAAASETQAKVKEAQQRLVQAQAGNSQSEQESAMRHLQEVQAQQADLMKNIASKSQAQIDAFKQLKGGGQK